MERYSYLQTMANSPLTPLTPLSENTQFEFNFGGDGSLDEYIDGVRQEHRVEQQRNKILNQANKTYHKKVRPPLPRRYSEEFLKILNVFEGPKHEGQGTNSNLNQKQEALSATPKAQVVKITYSTPTPKAMRRKLQKTSVYDYDDTPKRVRTPLKLKNNNGAKNLSNNIFNDQRLQKLTPNHTMQRPKKQQHLQTNGNRKFLQSSPVAVKPLCPHVAKILQRCGLSSYCGIFQREEIDLLAFRLLRLRDLHNLGITNQEDCCTFLKNILYVRRFMYLQDF